MRNTFTIEADIKRRASTGEIVVVQNDSIRFIVAVFDNGNPFDLSNVETVSLANTLSNKQTVVTPGTIVGTNTIQFDLGTNETQATGGVNATVQLYDSEGRVSTISFSYKVIKDPTGESYVPSETEQTLIEVVLNDGPLVIQDAQDQANYAKAQGDYAKQVADENKTNFLAAVATVADRDTTYPTPSHGDTVRVTSEAKTYRYVDGTGWVVTDEYNPTAIDEVNAQLADTTDSQGRPQSHSVWSEFGNRAINVKWFGAKGDGVTDDTTAIQNAINSMTEGSKLIVPEGNYLISNIIFNPPKDCGIKVIGRFISIASSGVSLTVGDDNSVKQGYTIEGLDIRAFSKDWSKSVTGIQFKNTFDGTFFIKRVYGFYKNIELIGKNGQGCGYNKFFIGRSDSGKKSLFLTTEGGWCNENSFYGGEFRYNGEDIQDSECILLTIDHNATNALNNNHFYSPSFENSGQSCAYIEGQYNQILFPRIEATGNIELTPNSRNNTIFLGLYFGSIPVSDSGQGNFVLSHNQVILNGNKDKTLKIKNYGSNSYKVLSFEDPTSTERFYVKASGELFSNQYGHFELGIRWYGGNRGVYQGSGSPEGVVTASPGSLYLNRSGGAGTTMYIKESGTGNTGWVAK